MIITNADLKLPIELYDLDGEQVRVSDLKNLTVKVYTTDPSVAINKSIFTSDQDHDYVYLNASDFTNLKSGVIAYTYSFGVRDDEFDDNIYDAGGTVYTDYYYKDCTENGAHSTKKTRVEELQEYIDSLEARIKALENKN